MKKKNNPTIIKNLWSQVVISKLKFTAIGSIERLNVASRISVLSQIIMVMGRLDGARF